MRLALAVSAGVLVPLAATSVQAHHSMAMFDQTKEMSVTGTVRQFQWANPHAYIQLVAKDGSGKETEWSMEMGSPMYLYARGWRPRSLQPGAHVTVKFYPLRDGKNGGVVLAVTDDDGQTIGTNQ